jgi:hypothetical protein
VALYIIGDYMNTWDVFVVIVCVVVLIGLAVIIVKGWFLPLIVYGFMAWLGFCGLMHLFIKW